jgi:hypothetical protein
MITVLNVLALLASLGAFIYARRAARKIALVRSTMFADPEEIALLRGLLTAARPLAGLDLRGISLGHETDDFRENQRHADEVMAAIRSVGAHAREHWARFGG